MAVTDIKYDDGLVFKNGDFDSGESEQKHIEDIILANKGEYRQFGLLGVGATSFLNGTTPVEEIAKRVKVQLEFDNFKVQEITALDDGSIQVIARQNEDNIN